MVSQIFVMEIYIQNVGEKRPYLLGSANCSRVTVALSVIVLIKRFPYENTLAKLHNPYQHNCSHRVYAYKTL